MDIYLTPNSGSKIRFPMLPESVTIGGDTKFMTYSIISMGEVKIPRGTGAEEISWSGKFPGESRKGQSYVRKYTKSKKLITTIEDIRDNGTKCTLLIPGTSINHKVYVSSFKGKYQGVEGDFDYDIKFSVARNIKIYTTSEKKTKSSKKKSTKRSSSSSSKTTTKTYTVKKGDTLWSIAKKKLGSGSRYTEIYKLNKKKIGSNPNKLKVGLVLTLPAS